MGITVMLVMGLLSMPAVSSIDFDGLDELRSRLEEAQEEQDEEDIQDTSELGWLDVEGEETPSGVFDNDLLQFLEVRPQKPALIRVRA